MAIQKVSKYNCYKKVKSVQRVQKGRFSIRLIEVILSSSRCFFAAEEETQNVKIPQEEMQNVKSSLRYSSVILQRTD